MDAPRYVDFFVTDFDLVAAEGLLSVDEIAKGRWYRRGLDGLPAVVERDRCEKSQRTRVRLMRREGS